MIYPPEDNEPDIATPEEQRDAIETEIIVRLGENWKKEWLIVHDTDSLVRLNKGKINLDFQADLLAQVEVIEREANPLQLSGRLIAFTILGVFLFVALAIATIAGIFN